MEQSAYERYKEILYARDSIAFQIESLRQFVRDFPDHGPGWLLLAESLIDVSRFAEAEDALKIALELSPTGPQRYVLRAMGDLSRHRGDVTAAAQWYRAAIEHSPDHAEGYIFLGAMLARLGRLEESEALHRRGTACAAGCVEEAHYNLGLVLRAQGRYAEALACFTTALTMQPQYRIARLAKRDVERALRVRDAASGG